MKTNINLQTKVATLLEHYPELEETLIELSPIFSKLKNPILRRTVARVTSLQQVAEIANISPPELIIKLRAKIGLNDSTVEYEYNESVSKPPAWFNESKIKTYYDACPIIEAGKSPMQDILKLAKELEDGTILQVSTPFKPIPIIDILRSKGFKCWTNKNLNFFIKSE